MEIFGMEVKLVGFLIAFCLLIIVPIWIIDIVEIGLFDKVIFTLVGGAATFYFVHVGGAKRGFISK